MAIFLKDVAAAVFAEMVSAHGYAQDDTDGWKDVRLVSNEDQTDWTINVGDASYDQWHGAACGASSWDTSKRPTKKYAQDIARDILDQVRDSLAQR
jgi:hypothetical protein